ncbi:MAG: hypothetical protein CVT93_08495 [Bacteroidetes bacterium HGW-Bacteroidetes-10]|nr:MAG: hypothetical protein CVT93_08495 [Bacteroidetes bacterium HGW-Bacteroidetes-10]
MIINRSDIEDLPCVSVIVPIYNVEKHLTACIKSIQCQTLSNIEIILVDDGSHDRSGEIADEFSKQDKRISVIHKLNQGLSSARNTGMSIACGRYISFIDSDDYVEPTMLEDMYTEARTIEADIVVAGVYVEYTLENRTVINNVSTRIVTQENGEIGKIFFDLYRAKLSNYAWNKIYRHSFLKNISLEFIEDAMPAEDLFFNLLAFTEAHSLIILNHAYYHYLRRDETTILSKYQNNLLKIEEKRKLAFIDFFNHFKMIGKEYSTFLERLTIDIGAAIVRNLYKTNSPLTRRERLHIISANIFNNKEFQTLMSTYIPNNKYDKIFMLLYKYTNPYFMELSYSVLFFLRRNLKGIYLNFRRNELK